MVRRLTFSPWTVLLVLTFLVMAMVGCKGKASPTATPVPTVATRALPTRAPAVTPPAGLPPAANLLPDRAWLYVHVEVPKGSRWTAVAYPDRDEIHDEQTNSTWVDKGRFLSRHRQVWEALFRQAMFSEVKRDAYLTACDACPRVALALRFGQKKQAKGIWTQVRPYDAPLPIFRLLPLEDALRLSVESIMAQYPASTIQSGVPPTHASPPPDPLRLLYGDALQQDAQGLLLGKNVRPWVLDMVSGSFTRAGAQEVVALVGGSVPKEEYTDEEAPYIMARLVIFRQQDNGTWTLVGKSDPLASNISRDRFPGVIDQVVDFDHDGRQEILVAMASLLPGYLDGIYHLYRWDGSTLRRVWVTTFMYDNTPLSDQPDYATQVAWPRWEDRNGDGVDEIVLKVLRRTYTRVPPGVPDTSRVKNETTSEVIFRWDGKGFQLVGP